MKFGIIGGNGGVARVHKESIKIVGGEYLICDIAGVSADFTNYLEMIPLVDVVVICTPNYLHYSMVVDALNAGKKVICEKPHALSATEVGRILRGDTAKNFYPVLQLRYNPELQELKERYSRFHSVEMQIQIHRAEPYFQGWKGKQMLSGGLLFNIGIHYFDFLRWFFGEYKGQTETSYHWRNSQGVLLLERAVVKWHLNIESPPDQQKRIVKIDGDEINLSYNFQNLHQEIYKEVVAGVPSSVKDIYGTYALIEHLMSGG